MEPHERAKALGWLSARPAPVSLSGRDSRRSRSVGGERPRPGGGRPVRPQRDLRLALAARVACRAVARIDGERPPCASAEPRPVRDAVWEVVRHPGRPVAHLIWIYAVAMLAYNSTPPVFALYLSQRFGINETNIGWFFIVFGGVGVLMRAFVVGQSTSVWAKCEPCDSGRCCTGSGTC